jgi:hypothetical protein
MAPERWAFLEVEDHDFSPSTLLYAPTSTAPKTYAEKDRRRHEAVDFYIAKNIEWFRFSQKNISGNKEK